LKRSLTLRIRTGGRGGVIRWIERGDHRDGEEMPEIEGRGGARDNARYASVRCLLGCLRPSLVAAAFHSLSSVWAWQRSFAFSRETSSRPSRKLHPVAQLPGLEDDKAEFVALGQEYADQRLDGRRDRLQHEAPERCVDIVETQRRQARAAEKADALDVGGIGGPHHLGHFDRAQAMNQATAAGSQE
jgi:hypothetical protein